MKLPAEWGVVLDFDGTCIPREHVALIPLVDKAVLPPEALSELTESRPFFEKKAVEGTISSGLARAWIIETIDLYAKEGVRLHDCYRALDGVRLKTGLKRFLADMHRRGVPVAIVSYGIKQFIWYVLAKEGALHLVSDIYAGELRTWDCGPDAAPIKDVDFETIVVPSFKGCMSERFARKYGVPLDRLLAIGDSRGDRLLGHLRKNRLALLGSEAEIARFGLRRDFGKLIVTRSFAPAHDWVLSKLGSG